MTAARGERSRNRLRAAAFFFAVLLAARANALPYAVHDSAAPADTSRVATPLSLSSGGIEEIALAPAPPESVTAVDAPKDWGHALIVHWSLSADDSAGAGSVVRYEILRSPSREGPFTIVGTAPPGTTSFRDGPKRTLHSEPPRDGTPLFYRVRAVGREDSSESATSAAAVARSSFFGVRALALVFAFAVLAAVVSAFRHRALSLRARR